MLPHPSPLSLASSLIAWSSSIVLTASNSSSMLQLKGLSRLPPCAWKTLSPRAAWLAFSCPLGLLKKAFSMRLCPATLYIIGSYRHHPRTLSPAFPLCSVALSPSETFHIFAVIRSVSVITLFRCYMPTACGSRPHPKLRWGCQGSLDTWCHSLGTLGVGGKERTDCVFTHHSKRS